MMLNLFLHHSVFTKQALLRHFLQEAPQSQKTQHYAEVHLITKIFRSGLSFEFDVRRTSQLTLVFSMFFSLRIQGGDSPFEAD